MDQPTELHTVHFPFDGPSLFADLDRLKRFLTAFPLGYGRARIYRSDGTRGMTVGFNDEAEATLAKLQW